MLRVLVLIAHKMITINWLKPYPPTLDQRTHRLKDVNCMENITSILQLKQRWGAGYSRVVQLHTLRFFFFFLNCQTCSLQPRPTLTHITDVKFQKTNFQVHVAVLTSWWSWWWASWHPASHPAASWLPDIPHASRCSEGWLSSEHTPSRRNSNNSFKCSYLTYYWSPRGNFLLFASSEWRSG